MFAIDRCVDHRDLCQPNNASLFLSPTLDRLTEACVHLENGSTWINDTVLSENRELAAAEYYYDVQRASDEKHVHAHGRGILSLLGCWMLLALACQGGWDLVFYTLPLLFGLPACIALAIMINELLLVKDFSVVWDHLVPSVKHLSNYQCWLFAATSSLLSSNIGVGFNSLIFARNAPKHDCLRSAFILVFVNFLINSFWSLSCTILLARNAAQMGRDLKDLLRDYGGEPDLIMLTSSLGQQAGTSQVWLAFLLLFSMLLGLGTSQAAVLVIETSLRELSVLGSTSTRAAVCLIVSAGFILDTMIYLFHDGPSLGAAVSAYANSYFNIVLALMLVCAVNVTLDAERLLDALSQQLTVPLRQLRWFWLTCWRLLCPLLLLGMFVSSVWHHATHPLQFRGVQLDAWAAAVAVVLAVAPLLLLLVEVFRVYAEFGSADAEELYRPTERWQLGLLPPNKRDSLSGAGGGNRSGSVGAAKSLMTRMYGAISSRWLVGGGSSVLRIESRVVPLDTGPGSPQTRTATTGSQQESRQNSEQSSRVATKSSSPDPGQRTSSTTKADGSYEVIASQYGT
ncbi:uncharacterized protein LOC122380421 [Amphibalanus amphitrite]|uniref:uncharacterized protein LOC122380421 n=1 Tax=Amphibalanus amphitrite TaxID=1232801 RepID=UPI001C92AA48|nr:uncharacterized protein LOC122380421 [Amphibalanus amphitrite]